MCCKIDVGREAQPRAFVKVLRFHSSNRLEYLP